MTRQEYDQLQQVLSNLLEKKDSFGRKIKRTEDYKEAIIASKSAVHSWFLYWSKGDEKK